MFICVKSKRAGILISAARKDFSSPTTSSAVYSLASPVVCPVWASSYTEYTGNHKKIEEILCPETRLNNPRQKVGNARKSDIDH